MLDDFENIIGKNFCQFADYEDFSFAQSRNTDALNTHFNSFYQGHFQGDFRVKPFFQNHVLPRLYFCQQGTKLVYNLKILNNINSGVLLQNSFNLPERSRSLVTPKGHMYLVGGYVHLIEHFSKNTFVLDEHRSILVPRQTLQQGRCDHAMHYFADKIYAFGGMATVNK
jgi:hypothetical protein